MGSISADTRSVLRVSPRAASWLVDLTDHFTPDFARHGDLYDVISGRTYLQAMVALNPLLTLADEITVRRARPADLTGSGLGFELLISHQGMIHNALVHLPAAGHPAWSGEPVRVVIDAHGFSDSPRHHTARSGLSEAAVNSGAVAIALGGSRGALRGPMHPMLRSHDGMKGAAGPLSTEDGPALIEFILDRLGGQLDRFTEGARLPSLTMDRARTVAVGFSNGGALAAKLAAAGTVSAAISFSGPTSPEILRFGRVGPTHIIFVEGAKDRIVPPGGPSSVLQNDFIAPDTAARFFAERNGAGPLNDRQLPKFLGALVQPGVRVRSAGDRETGLVAVIQLDDNGHAVPGSRPTVSASLDPHMGMQSSQKIQGHALLTDLLEYLDTAAEA